MKKEETVSFIEIKSIDDSHLDLIFNLNKNLVDKYENILEIQYDKVLNWIRNNINDNAKYFNAIYYKKELAGFFSFSKTNLGYEIDSLFVFDKFQNLGIGTFIIKHCLNSVDCEVFLYVFKQNKAFNLYKKLGFKIIKEINKNRYLMINENKLSKNK